MGAHTEKEMCFIKRIFVQISPVLVGIKPSVLIGICEMERCCGESDLSLWLTMGKDMLGNIDIAARELRVTLRGRQVLFYNAQMLQDELREPAKADFLSGFGYSLNASLRDKLDLLAYKCQNHCFPHEIGVFLGYPLKDVKGFIEKVSAPLAQATRWRVFGDPACSLRLMSLHEKAERVFAYMMERGKDPVRFLDKLSAHFQRDLLWGEISA